MIGPSVQRPAYCRGELCWPASPLRASPSHWVPGCEIRSWSAETATRRRSSLGCRGLVNSAQYASEFDPNNVLSRADQLQIAQTAARAPADVLQECVRLVDGPPTTRPFNRRWIEFSNNPYLSRARESNVLTQLPVANAELSSLCTVPIGPTWSDDQRAVAFILAAAATIAAAVEGAEFGFVGADGYVHPDQRRQYAEETVVALGSQRQFHSAAAMPSSSSRSVMRRTIQPCSASRFWRLRSCLRRAYESATVGW